LLHWVQVWGQFALSLSVSVESQRVSALAPGT
jgi:hypothetical protein